MISGHLIKPTDGRMNEQTYERILLLQFQLLLMEGLSPKFGQY